jgi:hypothetical protein
VVGCAVRLGVWGLYGPGGLKAEGVAELFELAD